VVFTADHGESLGEHGYWGHGRHLYEPSLRVPLGIVWRGTIAPGTLRSQVTLLDLAPTLLGLFDLDIPDNLPGDSLAEQLLSGSEPAERIGCYQAHRGAVHGSAHDSDRKRSKGLLAVGTIQNARKEIMYFNPQASLIFDLVDDPAELQNGAPPDWRPSTDLLACLAEISDGLGNLDRLATQKLDAETVEKLRALGYLE
jgi:arylsulfatase A-like enzyme